MSARGWTMAAIAALGMATSAAPAAMAEGEEFHSEATHTIVTGEATTPQLLTVTEGELGVECQEVSTQGTAELETTSEVSVSLAPQECVDIEKRQPHVYLNSCAFIATSEIPAGKEHAQVHIECEDEDEIEFKYTTIFGELTCIAIPAQTPTGGGVAYANDEGHIDVEATVTGIEYTEVSLCGEDHVANDGTYSGSGTISGADTGESPVGIFWE